MGKSSKARCPEDRVIAQPSGDETRHMDITTLKKIIQYCSVLQIIGAFLIAIQSATAMLVNSGSGLAEFGLGFVVAVFVLVAAGFGLLTSLKPDTGWLMLLSSIVILISSLLVIFLLLLSLVFFLFDASLLNFCENFYEDVTDCSYDLMNIKIRLVVDALGMIVAVATCCVAIIEFVHMTRYLCCQSAVRDEPPSIILLHRRKNAAADEEMGV